MISSSYKETSYWRRSKTKHTPRSIKGSNSYCNEKNVLRNNSKESNLSRSSSSGYGSNNSDQSKCNSVGFDQLKFSSSQSNVNSALLIRPLTASILNDSTSSSRFKSRHSGRSHSSARDGPRRSTAGQKRSDFSSNEKKETSIQLLGENNNNINVETIDFKRRGLTYWPVSAENTGKPKLLSLQHNHLKSIDPPTPFLNLVFLDLYHNQISKLDGLENFPNLRVLLAAKNKITKLDGLMSIMKLEVLDLHGNQISQIKGLSHLKDLKHLNLAGNTLRHVDNLKGLDSLLELNLRRNQVRMVNDLNFLPVLQKVFLSFNEIYRYEDINCLENCTKLHVLSLDENPISKTTFYAHTASVKFASIERLDDAEITTKSRKESALILKSLKYRKSLSMNNLPRATNTQSAKSSRSNEHENAAIQHWNTIKLNQKKIAKSQKPFEETTTEEKMALNLKGFLKLETTKQTPPSSTRSKRGIKRTDTVPLLKTDIVPKNICTSNSNCNSNSNISSISNGKSSINNSNSNISCISNAKINSSNNSSSKFSNSNSCNTLSVKKNLRPILRSKSSIDLKLNVIQKESYKSNNAGSQQNGGPKYGPPATYAQNSNPKLSSRSSGQSKNNSLSVCRQVIRTHSESKLLVHGAPNKNNASSYIQNSAPPRPEKVSTANVKRTIQYNNLKNISSKVLSAAFTKIQTNLCHLNQSVSPISSSKTPEDFSESSEDSSVSDSESSTESEREETDKQRDKNKIDKNRSGLKMEGPKMIDVSQLNVNSRDQNFYTKLDNNTLRIYGNGNLKYPELLWDKCACTNATTVYFENIEFDDITEIFPKLRSQLPGLENFIFSGTNIKTFAQLNALSEIHKVNSIHIKDYGNPIVDKPNWKLYAVFRLSHWGINCINDFKISEEDRQKSTTLFSPLCQLAFSSLPKQQLNVLISATSQSNNSENREAENEIGRGVKLNSCYLQELIGKEALQYRPTSKFNQIEKTNLQNSRKIAIRLLEWTIKSATRLKYLEGAWPTLLHDMTREAMTDINKINYGKTCLDNLKKDLRWQN